MAGEKCENDNGTFFWLSGFTSTEGPDCLTYSGRLFDAGFAVSGHYRVSGGRPQYIVFAMCLSVYEGGLL